MSESKVIFISGGNKGLGLETARQLAEAGNEIIIGSRDKKNGEAAAEKLRNEGLSVMDLELDITDSGSIEKAVNKVDDSFGKLDVLINNAGAVINEEWLGNTVETLSIDDLKKTFDVNFFSTIVLTRKFLPLLRKSRNGTIINVSSIMGSLELHYDPDSPIYNSKSFGYNSSKTALNQFTVHLAHLLSKENIKVYSAHPGWVKTDIGGGHAPLSVEEGAKTMVDLALDKREFKSGSYVHLDSALPW